MLGSFTFLLKFSFQLSKLTLFIQPDTKIFSLVFFGYNFKEILLNIREVWTENAWNINNLA